MNGSESQELSHWFIIWEIHMYGGDERIWTPATRERPSWFRVSPLQPLGYVSIYDIHHCTKKQERCKELFKWKRNRLTPVFQITFYQNQTHIIVLLAELPYQNWTSCNKIILSKMPFNSRPLLTFYPTTSQYNATHTSRSTPFVNRQEILHHMFHTSEI